MEDGFLTNYMIVYIKKEIAEKFTTDMIIDDFYAMKHRRAQLKKWGIHLYKQLNFSSITNFYITFSINIWPFYFKLIQWQYHLQIF